MRWAVMVTVMLLAACDDNLYRPIVDIAPVDCSHVDPGHVYGSVRVRSGKESFETLTRATVSYSSTTQEFEIMLTDDHMTLFLNLGENTSTLLAGNDSYHATATVQPDCGVGGGRFETPFDDPGLSGWYNTYDGTQTGGW